jgi:hypothetical protein
MPVTVFKTEFPLDSTSNMASVVFPSFSWHIPGSTLNQATTASIPFPILANENVMYTKNK